MSQLLQWIGTFASIISVPLAVFFYYKTIDGKYEKVKKELINLFSSYIGTGNKLSLFYIASVINSKLRENNLKAGCITTNSIIEDLIAEIISNPLLNNEAKKSILYDLETLINPVVTVPDGKLAGGKTVSNEDLNNTTAERRRKIAEALRSDEPVVVETRKEKGKMQLDKKIQIITGWVSIIAAILSFLISTGQVTEIFKIIDLTNTVSQILIGIVASIMAALVMFLIEKIRRKK